MDMVEFLTAVREHRTNARDALIACGNHPAVIVAKAEKAARKGYTDYGVAADRCWLTDKGAAFLSERGR